MEKTDCATCRTEQTNLQCGLCLEPVCKGCAHVLATDAFSFLPNVPEELTKGIYCHPCFLAKVEAPAEAYEATMEAARNVDVYFSDQGKETRLIPRSKHKYKIDSCADRDELVLRFAFMAVLDGFKTLVDTHIVGKKVRDGARQTTNYSGTAVPANAKPNHIPKDKSLRHNPN